MSIKVAIGAGFTLWAVALLVWVAALKFLEYDFACLGDNSGDDMVGSRWQCSRLACAASTPVA